MLPTSGPPVCELAIERETLSAWRDEALPAAETAKLTEHIATCAACEATLADFTLVAQTLAAQSVPPVPSQTWPQLRQIAAQPPKTWRRRQVAIAITISSVALIALIIMVTVIRWVPTATSVVAEPYGGMGAPTPIPQVSDEGLMYNPTIGNDLAFAFFDHGSLAIRLHGQVFNIPVPMASTADTKWGIAWSPDQSRLFVTTQIPGEAAKAWSVFIADNTVTALPATSPVAAACGGNADGTMPCQWLLDRYILYPQHAAGAPDGTAAYGLYDLQTQQVTPTTLAQQSVQYTPVIRGPYIFFTPAGSASIMRFDSVTNLITPLVPTLPGAVIDDKNQPAGGWSLDADTQKVLFVSAQPAPHSCGTAIRCLAFYLPTTTNAQTPSSAAFTSDVFAHIQDQSLSPMGNQAVALVLGAQGEQVISAYQYPNQHPSTPTVMPLNVSSASTLSLLGWVQTPTGATALVRQVQLDANYQPMMTTIYQLGNGVMPVMTVTKNIAVFAPPYEQ